MILCDTCSLASEGLPALALTCSFSSLTTQLFRLHNKHPESAALRFRHGTWSGFGLPCEASEARGNPRGGSARAADAEMDHPRAFGIAVVALLFGPVVYSPSWR